MEHICDAEGVSTIGLPICMDMITKRSPQWFQDLKLLLKGIESKVGNGFPEMMKYIKEQHNPTFLIPQLSL